MVMGIYKPKRKAYMYNLHSIYVLVLVRFLEILDTMVRYLYTCVPVFMYISTHA